MEDLKSLVSVVSKQKIKQIDIVSQDTNKNSMTRELYEGILSGVLDSDTKAAKYIYNTHPKDPKYVKLKYRLRQKLYNTLFFIDTNKSNYSDQRRAFYKVCKDWICARMLINQLSRPAAISLAENALKNSLKFDFTDISLLLLRELRMHYGYIQPNKKKFERFENLLEQLQFVFECELKAEKYYTIISNKYAVSKSSKSDELMDTIDAYCQELSIDLPRVESFTYRYLTYSLISFKSIMQKDYKSSISTSLQALNYFESKPFNSKLTEYSFRNDLIFCYLNLKDYKNALFYIQKNLDFVTPGTHNWLRVMNFYFMQTILSEDYNQSQKVVKKVLANSKIKSLETHYQSWLVKEAYTHLLQEVDMITSDSEKKSSFRLSKFLNDVPIYSKDKRGLNISILIIQILYLVINKKFDTVINRIDALNQYCYRYLRNDDTLRSNCFIKMLLKLPDADYHPVRINRHVKKYWQRLKETPMEISEQSIEIEIIPYEKLWDVVLKILTNLKK